MSDSIQVAIKLRPLIKREKDDNLPIQWAVVNNVIVPTDPEKKRGENGFTFDYIFDSSKTNSDVFEAVVQPIVDAAVSGFNGTVFAYGQTSSGKTYTMLGTLDEPGIIPMAVQRIFDCIDKTLGREFLLRVSYLEIYNEKVNDLLDKNGVDLRLREDINGTVQVKSKEEVASTFDAIMSVMRRGDKNRRIGETDMNEKSSRSHSIFRITIESKDLCSDSDGAVQVSQLNLVDLAGSERARQTNATGERFKEGTHINMSLSALGLVIKQLSESSDTNKFINFRDSKLTRILQTSLGGNAMTAIICAITPAAFEETQCTLGFASRAKSVKNKPELNEIVSDAALLKRYKKQIAKLNEELKKQRNENRIAEVEEMESKLQEKEHKLQETDRLNQLLEERIQLLKNGIISSSGAKNENDSKSSKSKRRRTWAGNRPINSRLSLYNNLPPIKEISYINPDLEASNIERSITKDKRRSIFQTVDLNDESFKTAFTDFELELIRVEKERMDEGNVTVESVREKIDTVRYKSLNHVKFQDDVEVYQLSSDSNWSNASTPEKQKITSNKSCRSDEASPGTPKSVLRERLNYIIEEYKNLQEFTTLEKQICSQQLNSDSINEKTFMQQQINGLLDRLSSYSKYQTEIEEQLSVSLDCINELTLRTPHILDLWKPSIFLKTKKDKVNTLNDLKQLEEILIKLKNEEGNVPNPITPLEKKLTNDYNECLKTLENVQSEKEHLLKENSEIKETLSVTSMKLKDADALLHTLREDTDCLMEKLIQKNNELSKLKEKLVELEQNSNNMEKSICINSLDVSVKRENNTDASIKSKILLDATEDKNIEILNLNQIIEEKLFEINNCKKIEEEIKMENVQLQESLHTFLKVERKCKECQTENGDFQPPENIINQIKKLSQSCQTEGASVYNNENNSNTELNVEIVKLTNMIEENLIEIENYRKLNLDMKEEIKNLKVHLGVEKVSKETQTVKFVVDEMFTERTSEEYQIEDADIENITKNTLINKSNEISGLLEVIQLKSDEIETYKQTEVELKEQINQMIKFIESFEITKQILDDIAVEKDDTISIQEHKVCEINEYELIEKKIKNKIRQLNKYLIKVNNNIEYKSVDCQTECMYEAEVTNDINYMMLTESQVIQQKNIEISNLSKELKENESQVELQQCLDALSNIERVKKESQIDCIFNSGENLKNEECEKMEVDEVENIHCLNNEMISEKIDQLSQTQSFTSKAEQTENNLKMKIDLINNQLAIKLEEINDLNTLNAELTKIINEKTNQLSDLQSDFEIKVQKLEQKVSILIAERSELREKLSSISDKSNSPIKISEEFLNTFTKPHTITENNENEIVQNLITTTTEKTEIDLKNVQKSKDLINANKNSLSTTINDDLKIVKPSNKKYELESSSIFANLTYFDNMEVSQSFVRDSTTALNAEINDSRDVSNMSTNNDNLLENCSINAEGEINLATLRENNSDGCAFADASSVSIVNVENTSLTVQELEAIKMALEKENERLRYDMQKYMQKTEDAQRVLSGVKQTLKELQQTVGSLTNENIDTSRQLTEAREYNNQMVDKFQQEIDILTERLSVVIDEKISLKSELETLHEQLENMRASTPIITDEEIKRKICEYQEEIKALTKENIDLSNNLMEKIDELENVKQSKIQMYDHECLYKEKSEKLQEKLQCLGKENIELSSDLTEQIEECDKLKETIDILKQQLEVYTCHQTSEDIGKNDSEFFKQENARLINDQIELKAKINRLTKENVSLSRSIVLENNDDHNESLSKSHVVTLNKTASAFEKADFESDNDESENESLRKKVEHLTLLNKKLGELKLPNCSQCAHVKELNESRRQLKLEVKLLTQKLAESQKKFEQKCADIEILRMKATEDCNTSLSLMNSTLNSSIYDDNNVIVVEEEIKNLHSEIEELKENCSKLSNQYHDKCNELEKLQLEDNSRNDTIGNKETKHSKSDTHQNSSKHSALEKHMYKLNSEIKGLRKRVDDVSNSLNEFKNDRNNTLREIESLTLNNEKLEKERNSAQEKSLSYEEKIILLEEELSSLYKQIEIVKTSENQIGAEKLEIEVGYENLLKEKNELMNALQVATENYKKELEKNNRCCKELEKQNIDLNIELQKVQDITQQLQGNDNKYVEEKLQDEINLAKSRIIEEIKSLSSLSKTEQQELSKKRVTDIFLSFLNAIVTKETEIVKRLQEDFEKNRRKLEEEKQQSIDAEKRANCWAKTLETDLEKLQCDLTDQEFKNKRLSNEINSLKENLKEAQHENQQLYSNIINLESHLNMLNNELDMKSKDNIDRDSVISAAQEKEKLARSKEKEWEDRFKVEKEEHLREVNEIQAQLENYKSVNDDLKNTIEGLDLEIEHLKNTIDVKTNDIMSANYKIENLEQEIDRMDKIIQQVKDESLDKDKHIKEITNLLKIKCDLLTEYKTKVETMNPAYESLQAQITERKLCIEKYKEEIHSLKLENKKHMDVLQDKLVDEEIKSSGLSKQVAELNNKNTALCGTIEELKDRCAELERDNVHLQRKVRNSTSKMKAENAMQDLQDDNRTLKNLLEGSYNRIKELQESKSQVQRELMEMQGNHGLLEQELNTTKHALQSLRDKYNNVNLQNLREKYDSLLNEKNKIILEVEDKKMLIANKDQKLVEYSIEMDILRKQKEMLNKELEGIKTEKSCLVKKVAELVSEHKASNIEQNKAYELVTEEKCKILLQLENYQKEMKGITEKNKELDEEMDELVKHIHKQENEIAELQDRLITGSNNESIEKIKALKEDNEKLKIDLRITEVNCTKLESEVVRLNSEKEVLLSKIEDLNSKIAEVQSKYSSRNSSKSNSPTSQKGRRRNRRSDIYNQNRNIDFDNDSREITDSESPSVTPSPPVELKNEQCQMCNELKNRIREISLDLVTKNSKITMIEERLREQNFPYQIKCNELKESILTAKTKISELNLENQKLQRALMRDSSRECHVCRQGKLNKREQGVQVNTEKIYLSGMSSGIIEDDLKLRKMEKERNWMKDLCRSRARRIKDLEQRIRELEGLETS